jgi:predicted membrane protein
MFDDIFTTNIMKFVTIYIYVGKQSFKGNKSKKRRPKKTLEEEVDVSINLERKKRVEIEKLE